MQIAKHCSAGRVRHKGEGLNMITKEWMAS